VCRDMEHVLSRRYGILSEEMFTDLREQSDHWIAPGPSLGPMMKASELQFLHSIKSSEFRPHDKSFRIAGHAIN
jgi:hypothetical protein